MTLLDQAEAEAQAFEWPAVSIGRLESVVLGRFGEGVDFNVTKANQLTVGRFECDT